MLLTDLREEFILNLQVLNRTKGTIYNHEYTLNRFIDYLKDVHSVTELEEVTASHIRQLILYWKKSDREKPITINGNIARMKVFFNYLVDEEYLGELDNPIRRIKSLKEEKSVIKTFSDDEVRRILASCKGKTYSNIRDKLILMMLIDCGLRVSELVDLKTRDVKGHGILVHGKGSKERILYISPALKKQMIKFESAKKKRFKHKDKLEMDDYYFINQCAKQMSRSRVNKILNEHAENAEVREEIRVSPHTCRHYFAHKQLRNGIDVYSLSRLMGHSDTTITTTYLRGLEDETIVTRGIKTSPLMNL